MGLEEPATLKQHSLQWRYVVAALLAFHVPQGLHSGMQQFLHHWYEANMQAVCLEKLSNRFCICMQHCVFPPSQDFCESLPQRSLSDLFSYLFSLNIH